MTNRNIIQVYFSDYHTRFEDLNLNGVRPHGSHHVRGGLWDLRNLKPGSWCIVRLPNSLSQLNKNLDGTEKV